MYLFISTWNLERQGLSYSIYELKLFQMIVVLRDKPGNSQINEEIILHSYDSRYVV